MTHKPLCNLYIASCTKDGGIWQYRQKLSSWEPVSFTPVDRPMYMTISDRKMYVLLRAPFDSHESGLITYAIAPDGSLQNPSSVQSTHGEVACHLCADENTVYAVNYISGSVIRMPDKLVVHTGSSIHPSRQTSPHTHYVNFTPDGRYLTVTDLGTDQICLYDRELSLQSAVHLPAGHGPRHLTFHEDGCHAFCVNELTSTVSLLLYENGKMQLLDTVQILPDGYTGESTSAAIRCDGNTVYTSNRGHDSVSVLDFEKGHLRLRTTIPTYGKCPRDFCIFDHKIIAANENDNTVCIISAITGDLLAQFPVSSPICVLAEPIPTEFPGEPLRIIK